MTCAAFVYLVLLGAVVVAVLCATYSPAPDNKCPRCWCRRFHHYCSRCGLLVPYAALEQPDLARRRRIP